MRRRNTDPFLKKLRLLTRSKRRSEALQLLQETLRQNPNHAMAREELSRHLKGQPYTFEEKVYTELQAILSNYLSTPTMLADASPRQLSKLRKRLQHLQKETAHLLPEREQKTLRQLQQRLSREQKRRRGRMRKPIGIAASVLLLVLVLGGSYHYLDIQADNAASVLHRAGGCETTSIVAANRLLAVHDTGLNRTLNRNVSTGADRLRALIRAAHQRTRELNAIFDAIESGKQTVVGQGVRRRAEIERMLQLSCSDADTLKQRWARLCQAEQEALNQQRLALSEEIMEPIASPGELSGMVETDASVINQYVELLQQRILLYEDAGETLGISPELMKPVQKQLDEATQLQQEIKALQQILQLLPSAHDYETYRSRLSSLNPKHYATAKELLGVLQKMPTEETVQGMMQEHGQNLRPGLLQASRQSLLEEGPSFCHEFPATREQTHLLEELLSNSALRTRLYELTDTAENLHAYTEQLPELRNGLVCFQRSSLDPERHVEQNKAVEWHNPHAVVSREIDPRPLFSGLGLNNRSGFLSTANLPKLLTLVFQIEGARIPALTRAYLFHHLLQANNSAAEPVLTGLRFAPAMRNRMEEFETLRKECGIELDGTCWLQHSPRHAVAERKFARWFNKHRKYDFVDELKHNLGTLLRIAPRFCGYVNEHSQPVLFEDAKPGQLIWYMGNDAAMTTSPWGEPLQQPEKLSPIFSVERQF